MARARRMKTWGRVAPSWLPLPAAVRVMTSLVVELEWVVVTCVIMELTMVEECGGLIGG